MEKILNKKDKLDTQENSNIRKRLLEFEKNIESEKYTREDVGF